MIYPKDSKLYSLISVFGSRTMRIETGMMPLYIPAGLPEWFRVSLDKVVLGAYFRRLGSLEELPGRLCNAFSYDVPVRLMLERVHRGVRSVVFLYEESVQVPRTQGLFVDILVDAGDRRYAYRRFWRFEDATAIRGLGDDVATMVQCMEDQEEIKPDRSDSDSDLDEELL